MRGKGDARFQKSFHLRQRIAIRPLGFRSNTVGRNTNIEVAHEAIVRGEENTNIGREAGDDQSICAQMGKKHFQTGRKESRVLRFKDEEIVLLRNQQLRHRRTLAIVSDTAVDESTKIGSPPPEIVIHVNCRDPSFAQPLLQGGNPFRRRYRESQQLFRLRKGEVVDHVNQQQDRPGRFWN